MYQQVHITISVLDVEIVVQTIVMADAKDHANLVALTVAVINHGNQSY